MDPSTAQRLFAEGKITQETLNAIIAKNEASFDTPVDTFDRQVVAPVPPEAPIAPVEAPIAPVEPVNAAPAPAPNFDVAPGFEPVTAPVTQPNSTPLTEDSESTPTTTSVVTDETRIINSKQKKATEAAKKAQEDLEVSMGKVNDAQAKSLEVDRQIAAETFNLNQEAQKQNVELDAQKKLVTDEGYADLKRRLEEHDAKVLEESQREYKSYWTNKSTGQKIMGALAMALGAYGSSTNGGPNTALSIINRAMDDDFAQFKDVTQRNIKAIESSRLGIEIQRSLIKDQRVALEARKGANLIQAKAGVDNLSNKFAEPRHQAKLGELGALLDQELAKSRLAFEKDLGEQVNTTVSRKLANIRKDADGNVIGPDRATKEEIKLSESYRKHPTVQAFDKISAQFNKIKSAEDSAAGDLSLIFSYMKILDPGSVVREGEFATAQNAAGVGDKVRNLFNKALTGERLTEGQRKSFIRQAHGLMKAQSAESERIRSQFTEEAKRLGFDPKRVVPSAANELEALDKKFTEAEDETGGFESFARGAQDVMPFGDTIEAAGSSFMDDMRNAFFPKGPPVELDKFGRPKNPDALTGTYDKRMEEVTSAIEKAKLDNPNLFTTGQVAGIAAQALSGGGLVSGTRAAGKAVGKSVAAKAAKVSSVKSVGSIWKALPADTKKTAIQMAKDGGMDLAIDYLLETPGLSTFGSPVARKILKTILGKSKKK